AAGESDPIDRKLRADNSAIERLKNKMADYQASIARIPSLTDLMKILAVGFGVTAVAHFGADWLAPWIGDNFPQLDRLSLTSTFFWIVVIATTGG
ncbi:MAG: DUF819 family protein, partial [Gemmatimonadetes bacterium]|nr:DUF819 family protein [Gemmatimonadota bacterium]NIQ58645.1 DUF819 family protein [Gemmatimonadota bacterium]NIU78836.1 DUF819 family protein [Gammaproteobacteria bacterium]NIX47636.1 DUF819 family protein [Gemmatimonadota bacterium]NIY11998.1 DUF819 family protein [Gemmatimonadota bacterium]